MEDRARGRNDPGAARLWLLDPVRHETSALVFDGLPGSKDDPLPPCAENAKVRAEREAAQGALTAPTPRCGTEGRVKGAREQTELAERAAGERHRGRATAPAPRCSCARSTTRTAGSPRWNRTRIASRRAIASPTPVDQLELQRIWLVARPPHAVVRVGGNRLRPALPPSGGPSWPRRAARSRSGGAAVARRPLVPPAQQCRGAPCYDVYRVPAAGGGTLERPTTHEGRGGFALRPTAASCW